MGNEQQNPGQTLAENLSNSPFFAFKSRMERAYRRHVYRYGDWHERDYRLKVWMITGSTILVLAIVIACVVRTDYLKLEEKRLASNAQVCLTQGDYAGAIASAGKALALNPNDLAACRAMADASAQSRMPAELYWVQRLADLSPTIANKLRLAEVALRSQSAPYPVTTVVLTELAESAVNNPEYQMIAGNLALALHQSTDAEGHFETAVQLDPSNPQYALSLATLQLDSANESVQRQARQQLEKLSLDGTLGAAALRTLVANRQAAADPAGADHYSEQLLKLPQSTMADRLQNLELLQGLNQTTFGERLQTAMALAANQPALVGQLSNWMQSHGLASANLQWLGSLPKNIRSEPAYKLALAQAYLKMGKWQDLLDMGNRDNWSDQDFLRLALISHAWAQLGEPTVAQSNWGEAIKKAGDHYEAMTNLLVLAENWQLTQAQQYLRQRILQLAPQ